MNEVQEFDEQATIDAIHKLKDSHTVLLFMKGSPEQPQCGFSSQAVQILQSCQQAFDSVDILQHPDIRATLKKVTDWPTFPQLLVNGELVGGSDILLEMYEAGELQTLFSKLNPTSDNQTISTKE